MSVSDPMSVVTEDVRQHLLNDGRLLSATLALGGFNGDATLAAKAIRVGKVAPASADQAEANAIPDRCAFIVATGGLPTRQGRDDDTEEAATVQITVRGDVHDGDAGHRFALRVYRAMCRQVAGYHYQEVFSGPPAWINVDDQGHDLFVINVLLKRTQDDR